MRRKHIELLSAFADFEEVNPTADLSEFYRYMLEQKLNEVKQPSTPADKTARFIKSIGRLMATYNIYLRAGLKSLDMKVPEGFPFLASLYHYGEMRKTDLINMVLIELSTGSEILSRLKKQGWITEKQDIGDKRARLVSISEKGRLVVIPCLEKVAEIRRLMLNNISPDEINTCIKILEPLEEIVSRKAVVERGIIAE